VLYDIAEKLANKGRRVKVILGGMDKKIRQQYVNEFQNGELDDLVCSLNVAGVGINLFRSSRCVFAEFPWTWAALDQASDRLHRIGQKDCVNVYHCFAKGTFEERQLHAIEERKIMTGEVIGL
jgi:SNF2 family DNA or RNA helicase